MNRDAVVTIKRVIAAPCEHVFDAWLDPERAKHFLFATPKGEIIRCNIHAQVGGRFLITDRRPDGDADHHGQFIEIDRPRRLAFLFRGPDTEEGEWSKVTLDFEGNPSGCSLTLTHEIPAKWAAYSEPVRNGWTMILDTLSSAMEKDNG